MVTVNEKVLGYGQRNFYSSRVPDRKFNLCNNLDASQIKGFDNKNLENQPIRNNIDYLLVDKTTRRLYALKSTSDGQYTVLGWYLTAMGQVPGPKISTGDKKTPEGLYKITGQQGSKDFHYSLNINYPNREDRVRAEALGVRPGSLLRVHGTGSQEALKQRQQLRYTSRGIYAPEDWTDGCIALTNEQVEMIARNTKEQTPLEICPDTQRIDRHYLASDYGPSFIGKDHWGPPPPISNSYAQGPTPQLRPLKSSSLK